MKDIDLSEIFDSMKKNDINEVIIKTGNVSYQIRRGILRGVNNIAHPQGSSGVSANNQNSYEIPISNSQFINNVQANVQEEISQNKNYFEVKSPLVGTFYATPKPDSSPFVDIGNKVSKGQTLCVIEAMKNFNEITSEVDGFVREICVKNGEIVEYGKILFRIETI